MGFRLLLLPLACLALSGCVSAVKTVVTAPVKAVGQVADWSTTSQEESDRNRGRAMRQREANLGKRSEEHTSELQSLMRNSYAVFCLKKKIRTKKEHDRN